MARYEVTFTVAIVVEEDDAEHAEHYARAVLDDEYWYRYGNGGTATVVEVEPDRVMPREVRQPVSVWEQAFKEMSR